VGNYTELLVWQKAIDLVMAVYAATSGFPKDEVFGLRMQMRRAAVSIPCNIAEGQGRETNRDYRYFLVQARGSLLELETQIVICERLKCVDAPAAAGLKDHTANIGRMLNGLLRYLTPDA
jgi:four helix bundle protein